MNSDHKLTDDQFDAGCLTLACMSVLLAGALCIIGVVLIIIVWRGCALGC